MHLIYLLKDQPYSYNNRINTFKYEYSSVCHLTHRKRVFKKTSQMLAIGKTPR